MSTAFKLDQAILTTLTSDLYAMAKAKGIDTVQNADLQQRVEQVLQSLEVEEEFAMLAEKYQPEILAGVHHVAPDNLGEKPSDGKIAGWIKVPVDDKQAIYTNRFLTDMSRTEPHVDWGNHLSTDEKRITHEMVFVLAGQTQWEPEPLKVLGSQDKPNQQNGLVLLQREDSNKIIAISLDHYQYFASKFSDGIELHSNPTSNLVQVLSNGTMVGMIATAAPARYLSELGDFKRLENLKSKIFDEIYGNELVQQAAPAESPVEVHQPSTDGAAPKHWKEAAFGATAAASSELAAEAAAEAEVAVEPEPASTQEQPGSVDLMDDLDDAYPDPDSEVADYDAPSDLITDAPVSAEQAHNAEQMPNEPGQEDQPKHAFTANEALTDLPPTIDAAVQGQASQNHDSSSIEDLSNSDLDAPEPVVGIKTNEEVVDRYDDVSLGLTLGPSIAETHPFISKDDYHKLVLHRLSEAVSQEHASLMIHQETLHLTRSKELAEQQAKFFRDLYEYAEAHNFDALGVACSRVIQKVVDFKNSGSNLKIPSARDSFVRSLETIEQVADAHKLSPDNQMAASAGMSTFKRNSTISQLDTIAQSIPEGPASAFVETDQRYDFNLKADPAYLATQAKDAMYRTTPEDVIVDGKVDSEWADEVSKKVGTIKEKLISSSLAQDVRDHINKMMDAILDSLKNLMHVAQLIVGKLLPSKDELKENDSASPAPTM